MMYRDPVVVRALERCRRWVEDRVEDRAHRRYKASWVVLSDEEIQRRLDELAPGLGLRVEDCPTRLDMDSALEERMLDLIGKHLARRDRVDEAQILCEQLAQAWQRLVTHDCLACDPSDSEACLEYQARNAEVNDLVEDLSLWQRRWVFRSLRLPRTRWTNGIRRWA